MYSSSLVFASHWVPALCGHSWDKYTACFLSGSEGWAMLFDNSQDKRPYGRNRRYTGTVDRGDKQIQKAGTFCFCLHGRRSQ